MKSAYDEFPYTLISKNSIEYKVNQHVFNTSILADYHSK